MRVLVTGATGFLGQHLTYALVRRGDFVVALGRDIRAPTLHMPDGQPDVVIRDQFDCVDRAIAEYEIDAVVHLAAQTQVSTAAAAPVATFEANIAGTWKVLEACRRQKVKRVIIASSDKAYGQSGEYKESQPLRPHGIYATSKACADMLATAYAHEYGLSIAITRCGNLYGPGHLNYTTLIPGVIRSFLRGEIPQLRSNGDAQRDWLYVEDAVDGYLKLLDTQAHGPFNFGTGKGTSVINVVTLIAKLFDKPFSAYLKSEALHVGFGGVEIDVQIVDATLVRRQLGWEPKHSLEEGLRKTVEWFRGREKNRG